MRRAVSLGTWAARGSADRAPGGTQGSRGIETELKIDATMTLKLVSNGNVAYVLLQISVLVDVTTSMAAIPMLAGQAEEIPFTLSALMVNQALFWCAQMGSTLLAERVAHRISPFIALTLSTGISAGNLFLVRVALEKHSLLLFCASRVVSGVFRHSKILSALTVRELVWNSARSNFESGTINEILATEYTSQLQFWALIGIPAGFMAGGTVSSERGVVDATGYFASLEAANAVILLLLYVLHVFPRRPRTQSLKLAMAAICKGQKSQAQYAEWGFAQLRNLRNPLHAIKLLDWAAVSLTMAAATCSQCQIPFVLLEKFRVPFAGIGLTLSASFGVQLLAAPQLAGVLTALSSTGAERAYWAVMALCALAAGTSLLHSFGTTVIPYIFIQLLLVDLPAGTALTILRAFATSAPSMKNAPAGFPQRAVMHVEASVKSWTPIALLCFSKLLPATRIQLLLPLVTAMAAAGLAASHHSMVTAAAVGIYAAVALRFGG